jgi:hypothetical protein
LKYKVLFNYLKTMTMNDKSNTVKNSRLIGILFTATLLLLVPLIAMQFSSGVNWTLLDFVVGGALLFGAGLSCELVMRKVKATGQRIFIIAIVLAAFFLIWAELAVGLFGTPFAGS